MQVGAALFLAALLVGLALPRFALPRLALSTHLLGLMQGTFLIVLGLVWPRLRLRPPLSLFACFLAIYGCLTAWTANLLGAIWGAGGAMVPLAAGAARGSALQETIIRLLLISAASSLMGAVGLVVWGLRGSGEETQGE
jgi:hydroxylaminobenzene mutase